MRTGEKIGIIAGGGSLPVLLAGKLRREGAVAVTGLIGVDFGVGEAGKIIDFFKSQSVKKMVLVGSLRRPNWLALRTDWRGVKIISKILFRKVGDDALLKIIRRELEKEGFELLGIHELMPELLCPSGALGKTVPSEKMRHSIHKGLQAARQHGAADKGQSVIVDIVTGDVIAREGRSGTDALMRSVAGYEGQKILVKASKPQQDLALDMPTVGSGTIETARQCGFIGIVVEAGKTLIPDIDDAVILADQYGIFIWGEKHDA